MNSTSNPFWRNTPLSEKEIRLLELVDKAHDLSATRGNISGTAVALSACGAGEYSKAIAAALMTIGGVHGPIEQSVNLLNSPHYLLKATDAILSGKKIPGWGNSFVKEHDDPIWEDVRLFLTEHYFEPTWRRVSEITDLLHCKGKMIYPNPSTYTAATAIALGIPAEAACYLFLRGRLDAWTSLFLNNKPK